MLEENHISKSTSNRPFNFPHLHNYQKTHGGGRR
jgi:hypothetical protein